MLRTWITPEPIWLLTVQNYQMNMALTVNLDYKTIPRETKKKVFHYIESPVKGANGTVSPK